MSKVFLHYPPIVRGRHLSKQRASIMHIHTNRCCAVRRREFEMERREERTGEKKERERLSGSVKCVSLLFYLNKPTMAITRQKHFAYHQTLSSSLFKGS